MPSTPEPSDAAPTPLPPLPPPESVDLVVAERPGDVVAPQPVKARTSGLSLPVTAPDRSRHVPAHGHAPRRGRRGLRQRDSGDAPDAHRASHGRHRRRDPRRSGDDTHRREQGRTAGPCRQPRHQLLGPGGGRRSTGGTTGRPATYATIVGWWLPSGERVMTTDLPPAIGPGSTVDATVT